MPAKGKVYAKIRALENEIQADQFDIDNGLATRFIPMELHLSVIEYKKRQKAIEERNKAREEMKKDL